MKRYRIPEGSIEIREIEGVICTVKKELVKINGEWQVITKLIPLDEIKND